MTEINLKTELKDFAGDPIRERAPREGESADQVPVATVRSVLLQACMVTLRGDENMSTMDKVSLAQLTQRLYGGDVVEFTAEQMTTLKDRIGRGFPPLIVLRTFEIVDPASVK